MNNKYFPITPGQGTFGLEESYRVEYKGIELLSIKLMKKLEYGIIKIYNIGLYITENYQMIQKQNIQLTLMIYL